MTHQETLEAMMATNSRLCDQILILTDKIKELDLLNAKLTAELEVMSDWVNKTNEQNVKLRFQNTKGKRNE